MSRRSKISFLFKWYFPMYSSYKMSSSKSIGEAKPSTLQIADAIFQRIESNIDNCSERISGNILESLDRLGFLVEHSGQTSEPITKDTIIRWLKAANEHRQKLTSLSPDELDKEFCKVCSKELRVQSKIDDLAFFNDHKADADLGYWLSMPYWSGTEAAALSLGKDPRVVYLKAMQRRLKDRMSRSVFAQEYMKRCEQVTRAQKIGALPEKITSSDFKVWASGTKTEIDDNFAAAMKALPKLKPPSPQDEKISGKTLNTYLKIIFGVAVKKYELDSNPHSGKAFQAARLISRDLETTQLSVDEKTIKKYIEEAQEYMKGIEMKEISKGPNKSK